MEASVSVIVVDVNDGTRRGLCRRLGQEPGLAGVGQAPAAAEGGGAVEVAVKGGALANAVIVIDSIAKGKAWAPVQAKPLLDQKGCRFIPSLMVVPRDGDLDILNSDPWLHNIHTYEITGAARRTLFNFGQPDQGKKLSKPVKLRSGEWV